MTSFEVVERASPVEELAYRDGIVHGDIVPDAEAVAVVIVLDAFPERLPLFPLLYIVIFIILLNVWCEIIIELFICIAAERCILRG